MFIKGRFDLSKIHSQPLHNSEVVLQQKSVNLAISLFGHFRGIPNFSVGHCRKLSRVCPNCGQIDGRIVPAFSAH